MAGAVVAGAGVVDRANDVGVDGRGEDLGRRDRSGCNAVGLGLVVVVGVGWIEMAP